MILNCKIKNHKNRYEVYLNERLVHSVWYVDRRRGCLRTYDVYNNGSIAVTTREALTAGFPIHPSWDAPIDGVLSKELRGKIRLKKIGEWNSEWGYVVRKYSWDLK